MKCKTEELDWCTAHSYAPESAAEGMDAIELTLSFAEMQELCRKYGLSPELGADEASYPAFRDWLRRHRRTQQLLCGHGTGFDIQSLVNLFHQDLTNTAKLERLAEASSSAQQGDDMGRKGGME